MLFIGAIARLFSLLAAISLLLMLAGCGGTPGDQAVDTQPGVDPSVVAQVQSLDMPGVDAELAATLKAELLRSISEHGRDKEVSTPPCGAENCVNDLASEDDGAGGRNLTWAYRNVGDYDQNSEVNAADITPVGLHYGVTNTSANWESARLADGDDNGEVNVADITPIGRNFNTSCAKYMVYSSSDIGDYPSSHEAANGPGAVLVGEVAMADSTEDAGGARLFSYEMGTVDSGTFCWVRPSDGSIEGSASNLHEVTAPANKSPEAVLTADPTAGDVPMLVQFDASGSSDPDGSIVQYEWDWDGNGTGPWDQDTGSTPTTSHDYTTPGIYTAWVRVTDDQGAADTTSIEVTAHGWLIQSLDTDGVTGSDCSLAIVEGFPAISYSGNSDLKYILAGNVQGTSWNTPVTVDAEGLTGGYTSLAVIDGYPAISYINGTDNELNYVRATDAQGATWNTPIAIDASGSVGTQTSLAVVDGHPAIAYKHYTNDDLMYVRAADTKGVSWNTPIAVDAAGDVGLFASLAVVDGNPAISYFDNTNDDLKYVRAADVQGTSWNTSVILDATDNVGFSTSLAIIDGYPAISYVDATSDDLKYVRAVDAQGASWAAPMAVDSAGDIGWFTSLALVDGRPAISYRDATLGELRFVGAADAQGTAWTMPMVVDSVGDTGLFSSLVAVDSRPAISYYDNTSGDLKFAVLF
jgi:hypothetical protein